MEMCNKFYLMAKHSGGIGHILECETFQEVMEAYLVAKEVFSNVRIVMDITPKEKEIE